MFHDRLERLRMANQWTWKQLAGALGLSVGFLIMVNKGKRSLSEKAEFRLRQIEAEAGLGPDPKESLRPSQHPSNKNALVFAEPENSTAPIELTSAAMKFVALKDLDPTRYDALRLAIESNYQSATAPRKKKAK